MNVGSIDIGVSLDQTKFEKSIGSLETKLKGVSDKLGTIGKQMSTKVTLPIAGAFALMGKSAMDLEATEAKFNTVFAGMTGDVDAFLAEFRKLTPATKAESRNMASGIQDLLVPLGHTREQATEMTGEFMNVVGALANFNSATHTTEQVANAVQSAITGEYQSLKSLGIQLSATQVEQKAFEMGLITSKDQMNKQIASQVLLAEIYGQSGDAVKAYTADNLDSKTQMALTMASVQDLAASFGEILLPVINKLTEMLRGVIEWFGGLDASTKETIIQVLAVIAAVGPLLLIFGKVIAIFKVLIGVGTALAGVIGAITAPVAIVIAIIAALIAAGVLLYKNWDTIKEKVKELKTKITTVFEDIKTAIKEKIDEAIQNVKDAFNGALTFVEGLGTKFFNAGKNIVTSIADGVKSAVSKVTNAIKGVAEKVRDFLPFSPAKEGPLKDLDKLDFGGPIQDSIDKAIPRVQAEMGLMFDGAGNNNLAGAGNITININDPVIRSDSDITRLSRALRDELVRVQRGQGR